MELPPLSQQLLSQLSQSKSNEGLSNQTLSPGTRLVATVESIFPATPQLRARLLQLSKSLTEQTLGNAQKPTSDPSSQAKQTSALSQKLEAHNLQAQKLQSQSLLSQQSLASLLQHKTLYAAQVKILGKLLLTFTHSPLTRNDRLNIAVRPDGQLQLTQKPNTGFTSSQADKASISSPLTPNAKGQLANQALAPGLSSSKAPPSSLHNTLRNNPQNAQQVSLALRQYLPTQKNLADSLTNIQRLIEAPQIQRVAANSSALSKLLQQMTQLTRSLPGSDQLLKTPVLKSNIQNSGSFLEANLSKLVKPATLKTTAASTIKNIQTQLTRSNINAPSDERIENKDLKAEVLQALKNAAEMSRGLPQNSQQKPGGFDKLIQSLFTLKTLPPLGLKNSAQQQTASNLLTNIQPLLFSILARISTLQLQRLVQFQQDPSMTTLGNIVEIPVRLGESIFPLTLNIHQREYEDLEEKNKAKEEKDKQREKRKRWHVFMEFDLGELGMFASDVCIEDNRVKTTLWIEQSGLWRVTKSHLTDLEENLSKSGIEVETLTCLHGKAPNKTMELQQSLVDIRT